MESDFKQEILKNLNPHFEFYPEVKGTHFSGKSLRIDHIIKPKNTDNWKNKEIVFGLEYKDIKRIDGDTKNYTSWLAQCVDYANTKWDNYGYIYILACPGITSTEFIKEVDKEFMLPRIMSQMGVGELSINEKNGWTIYLQGEHRLWSEKNGVEQGKTWGLERKFGSR